MITLRDYQVAGELDIRQAYAKGFKAPLYVLPCGGGKTVTFAGIARSAERRGRRVLILCHRVELVDQIVTTLGQFDVRPDIVAAGYGRRQSKLGQAITVASVQTLVRRLENHAPPTLIIIDEAHHTAAGSWANILRAFPMAKLLGVTASPIRLDGRGLGTYFDHMIIGPSVKELTDKGYLAPVKLFAPPGINTSGLHIRAGEYRIEESEALLDTPAITGDAFAHYRKHADGLPALTFCTSVAHAHHVAEKFRDSGIQAVALDGNTAPQVRRMAVDDFRRGALKVISQCEIATEGWDLPGVHCGIFLRPTMSLGLWIQMTGRCSRLAPGKSHAILLDHTGNVERHGLPEEPREWALTYDIAKKKKKPPPSARVCPKCWAASPARAHTCVECGHVFEVKPRQDLEEREGELKEVAPLTPEERERRRERQNQGRAKSLEQLEAFGRTRGYAPGWARKVWEARQMKRAKA